MMMRMPVASLSIMQVEREQAASPESSTTRLLGRKTSRSRDGCEDVGRSVKQSEPRPLGSAEHQQLAGRSLTVAALTRRFVPARTDFSQLLTVAALIERGCNLRNLYFTLSHRRGSDRGWRC